MTRGPEVCLLRVPLASAHAPEAALLTLREDERPFALVGAWAGGGAILGSEPVALADPDTDPFATVEELPPVAGEGRELGRGAVGVAGAGQEVGTVVGGGWFGWFGYRLGSLVESLPPSPPRPVPLASSSLAFYDHVLRRDGAGQWWFEALWSEEAGPRLQARLATLRARMAAPPPPPAPFSCGEFRVRPTRRAHLAAVRACREAIRVGELYQANLTLRLEADLEGEALDLFVRCARELRPPYSAYVGDRASQVASLSPELFLARRGRSIRAAPIKGTTPRTGDHAALERLLASEKDRAENVMIVDLLRNDLGRVCEYGSIGVADLARAEAHPGVWHLVSEVHGRVRECVSDGDVLRATFPPGSVTGAPKVKAMEVISRLESTAREAYTGAIGYVSPIGGMELNVAIRTFEVARGAIWLGAGGGIVADSDPEAEYRESVLKAEPLVAAAGGRLRTAEGTTEGRVARRRLPPEGDAPEGVAPERVARRRLPPPTTHPRPDPAAGILETLAVVDGEAVELGRHLERLRRSACELYGPAAEQAVSELERRSLEAAAQATGVRRLRLILRLQPDGPPSPALESLALDPNAILPQWPLDLHPLTVPGGLGRHKWLDRRLVEGAVAGRDRAEALILDLDGAVLESGRGSVFVVEGEAIVTPPLDGRQLPGVTRALVREHVDVREEAVDLERLQAADEAFLTSAVRGVQPARTGGQRHRLEAPGPVTRVLAQALSTGRPTASAQRGKASTAPC